MELRMRMRMRMKMRMKTEMRMRMKMKTEISLLMNQFYITGSTRADKLPVLLSLQSNLPD